MPNNTQNINENTLYAPKFSDEWEDQFLHPLADWINGMAFKDFNFSPKGKPVIKIAEIKDGITGQTKFTDGRYNDIYLLKKKDMLFCWSGQPETSIDVFWWNGPEGWLNQHIFKVIPKIKNKIFFYFLLKYLKPNFIQIACNKQTTGLGHVTKKDLEQFKIKLPSNNEQNAIAAILLCLDDKIELLRLQNTTLENIARSLFKRWFIDFEFSNEDGNPYKSSGGKMIDSEFGEIPNGWNVETIEQITSKVTKGTTPTTIGGKFSDSGINFIKAESITNDHYFDMAKFSYIDIETNELLSRSVVCEGDLLYSIAGTIGRFAVVPKSILPANTNQAVAIIRANEEMVDPFYLQCVLSLQSIKETLIGNVVEAVQANLSLTSLRDTKIIIPDANGLNLFRAKIRILFDKIVLNKTEIQTLSKMRDMLLPKLMKGEIRVGGNN